MDLDVAEGGAVPREAQAILVEFHTVIGRDDNHDVVQ